MKLFIFAVLTVTLLFELTACNPAPDADATDGCTNGDTKKEDCNSCTCRNGNWACTRIACNPPHSVEKRGYTTSVSQATSGKETRCKPRSTWKVNCNTCTCSTNGRYAYCTERGCLAPGLGGDFPSGISLRGEQEPGAVSIRRRRSPPESTEQICVPNSTFQEDCNTCICNADGTNAGCTQKICLNGSKYVSELKKEVCVPNSTFKKKCNYCACNADGTMSICTEMECIKPPKQDSANETCVPNTIFMKDCNTCVCSADGTGAYCTKIECPKPVEPDSKERTCVPGSVFKDDCNTCICDKNGTGAICTLMACKKPVKQDEKKRVCVPGSTFKRKCNTCHCSMDGTFAGCTRILCPETK